MAAIKTYTLFDLAIPISSVLRRKILEPVPRGLRHWSRKTLDRTAVPFCGHSSPSLLWHTMHYFFNKADILI